MFDAAVELATHITLKITTTVKFVNMNQKFPKNLLRDKLPDSSIAYASSAGKEDKAKIKTIK